MANNPNLKTPHSVRVRKGLGQSYWCGYLSGVLNGISMRHDVPKDVREVCKQVYEAYSSDK